MRMLAGRIAEARKKKKKSTKKKLVRKNVRCPSS